MFTKDISSTFDKNIKNEWLITNGIGGYASSTIIGVNTRKYHGLLVASLGDNMERVMTLAKFNEYITVDGTKISLSSNECRGFIEKGYVYEEAFERKLLPEFLFNVQGVELSKKLAMPYGENKVCVRYNIVNTNDVRAIFALAPLVNYRSFHAVSNANSYVTNLDEEQNILQINVSNKNKLFIKVDDSKFTKYDDVFYSNMFYRIEEQRGFDCIENHFIPGEFKVEIPEKSQVEIYVVAELNSTCTIDDKETKNIIRSEEIRLEKLCKIAGVNDDLKRELVVSADQFIVNKNSHKSIIAGYPWFQDWGRDVFISLEGLTLKTNRFQDAKSILKYFANYIRRGLVPNFIDEKGGGSYNTVDASLWYIEAVSKFVTYTNDLATLKEVFPKLLEIVYSYMVGTDFNIYMDDDGLICSGNEQTQLTWMDAKVGDIIPTPRYGKAVEINALWYNAINVLENLNNRLIKKFVDNTEGLNSKDIINKIYRIDNNDTSNNFNESKTKDLFLAEEVYTYYDALSIVFDGRLASKVKESYKKFYADVGLFDTISPYNEQIRPNQILALSLSYPVISGDKAKEVFNLVTEKLYTNKGLKTLNSEDPNYKPRYEGDSYNRDISYHQGTIWPWILGQYAKAFKYIYKKDFRFDGYQELLNDGCVGNVAEIYDADEPREAKGALAQAWSVAALISILF